LVFPIEAEHRAKRRALRLCQDHLRRVIDIYRKTTQLMDAFTDNDEASLKKLHGEVQNLGDGVDDSKRAVAQELVEIGAILINREDFLRFTDVTSEVADFCKGIAFRLSQMIERGWYVSPNLKKGLIELAGAVFDTVSMLRDTFLMLNYGSPKVLEKARDVEIAERKVDDIYRGLEITILESKLDIHILLLMRDVIQLLEDTADKIEDASDAARILAFAL
jgi:predicted phosphate transport protein (TIGR00153 family)